MAGKSGFVRRIGRFFGSLPGIVVAGLLIGIIASSLQKLGNPPNMGICAACFTRDIAGAVGLHRLGVVQYIRPEIIGFVLGAMVSALVFGEFKPRTGSAPIARFMLGASAMVGVLVFLGCPWRALLRLAGGDLNALLGLAGLALGVGIGSWFLKRGYTLGRSHRMPYPAGFIMPLAMAFLLGLLIWNVSFKEGQAIFFSAKGPGAMHAPLWTSLAAGLVIGALAQRTRFCTVGAIRDVILIRNLHLLFGVGALVVGAFAMNMIFGQFKVGVTAMPVSHSNHAWNFLGMALAGLAFALAGGCPGRQLFLSGEGDGDAAIFSIGMLVSAALAHNWFLAAAPDKASAGSVATGGPSVYGKIAVLVGLVSCIVLGFTATDGAQPRPS